MAKEKPPAAAEPSAPEPSRADPTNPKAPVDSRAKTDAENSPAADAEKPTRKRWFRATIIVLFGLFYAWDLFEAISNMLGKLDELARRNEVRELNGFAPIDIPWAFLIANLVLPLVVFGLALLVARKRNVGILAIALLAGLGVVAAVSLTLIAIVLRIA